MTSLISCLNRRAKLSNGALSEWCSNVCAQVPSLTSQTCKDYQCFASSPQGSLQRQSGSGQALRVSSAEPLASTCDVAGLQDRNKHQHVKTHCCWLGTDGLKALACRHSTFMPKDSRRLSVAAGKSPEAEAPCRSIVRLPKPNMLQHTTLQLYQYAIL